MKEKRVLLILILLLVILSAIYILTIPTGSKECTVDSDCVVFGETGDCNCGCYNKDHLPSGTGGECFCLAPEACKCVNGECEGVFEEINSFEECAKHYPVMESYPPQCAVPGGPTFTEDSCQYKKGEDIFILTISEAKSIAKKSECGDRLKETYMCNEFTGTYWIDLDIEKEGCNPACVVNVETREGEINWRCTGLITCAKEGEQFSVVYDEYPDHCCEGLTEWHSGMDTRISIADECYETGLVAGSPVGTCINCGNGICEEIEDPCNCPEDCIGKNRSDYLSIEEFCQSDRWTQTLSEACQEGYPEVSGLPMCELC